MKYNTTDNRYQGTDKAMVAAQKLADVLRAKYTMHRDGTMDSEVWDRIFADEGRWLDEITVETCWQGGPAVIWENDTEWAFKIPMDTLEAKGFYFEPYYSFAVNVYEI